MKFTTKQLPVSSAVRKIKNLSLDLAPEYQRGPVWSKPRQALLIDSMLKGYDLPKFYLRQLPTENETFEVVDGLQRLTSMVNFLNGDFALPKVSEWAGLRYIDLPEVLGEKFDDYQLDFTILEGFSDDDVRDMFLRLQNGVRLNAAEELNAVVGGMHNFVEELTRTTFFQSKTSYTTSRGANRHVAAQIALLATSRKSVDVRKQDLLNFYSLNKDWSPNDAAKTLKTVLNWLATVFEDNDPALRNRGQTVTLVTATMDLWEQYSFAGQEKAYLKAIYDFDKKVLSGNKDFKDYATAISHSSDQSRSIEVRREILLAALSDFVSQLPKKDGKRTFSLPDRVLAWYTSDGRCQSEGCTKKLTFQDFHADHKQPWSKGGKSELHNLQVLCPEHNLTKGAK
jgi:hypothetical protein